MNTWSACVLVYCIKHGVACVLESSCIHILPGRVLRNVQDVFVMPKQTRDSLVGSKEHVISHLVNTC